jgi:hypothetical protein
MAIAPHLTAWSIPPGSQSHMGLPQRVNFAERQICLIHVLIHILRQMSHEVSDFNETGDRD